MKIFKYEPSEIPFRIWNILELLTDDIVVLESLNGDMLKYVTFLEGNRLSGDADFTKSLLTLRRYSGELYS